MRPRHLREAVAEQLDHGRHHPLERGGAGQVLEPAHGRLGAQVRPALGRPAERHLERRVGAQGVAVVGVGVAGRDQQHPEADHLGQAVVHPPRCPRVLDAAGQALGDPEPALDLGQHSTPASEVRRPPSKAARTALPATEDDGEDMAPSARAVPSARSTARLGIDCATRASAPDQRDRGGRRGLAARAGLGPVRAGVPRQRRRRRGPARADGRRPDRPRRRLGRPPAQAARRHRRPAAGARLRRRPVAPAEPAPPRHRPPRPPRPSGGSSR